jgi:hypothetical protein
LRLVVIMHSLAWFQGSDKKVFRAFHFTLLNCGGRVDMLRTDFGAITHKVQVQTPFWLLSCAMRSFYRGRGCLRYSGAPG